MDSHCRGHENLRDHRLRYPSESAQVAGLGHEVCIACDEADMRNMRKIGKQKKGLLF